jgi:hypothetical protein
MNNCSSSDVGHFKHLKTLSLPHSLFQVVQTLQPFFERMAIDFPLVGVGEGQSYDKKKNAGCREGQDKKGKGTDEGGKRTACFPLLQFAGWKKANKEE